ncbi:MAG: hypothetical protein HKN42_06630 [Granulosicoccus sp.]|nr:hypothetical protein [Granulosicoccus sp.]
MMRRVITCLLCGCVLSTSAVQADLRVLFRFDETGVQVHKVISTTRDRARTDSLRTEVPDDIPAAMATLIWRDENGAIAHISIVPDPRVSHSPEHMYGTSPSQVGLSGGAWVADAPDNAYSVVIELQERVDLALSAETWTLYLRTLD